MKKHSTLIAILGIFAVAFVAGLAFIVVGFLNNADTQAKIDKNSKTIKQLANKKSDFALTEANKVNAEKNLNKLKAACGARIASILQEKRVDAVAQNDIPKDATDLKSRLQGRKNDWLALCADTQIESSAQEFGFSRYLGNEQLTKIEELGKISTQARVVDTVLKLLLKAKKDYSDALHRDNIIPHDEAPYLRILNIRREAFELSKEQCRSLQKDELFPRIDENSVLLTLQDSTQKEYIYPTLRRKGIMDAFAVQFDFIGDTALLRNLLEQLGDYSIYIRDLKTSRAEPEQVQTKAASQEKNTTTETPAAANPFSLFNTPAQTTVATKNVPVRVVAEAGLPERFIVTLEYIIPREPEKKEATEKNNN